MKSADDISEKAEEVFSEHFRPATSQAAEIERLKEELKTSNWRKSWHCDDAAAYGKQASEYLAEILRLRAELAALRKLANAVDKCSDELLPVRIRNAVAKVREQFPR